MTIDFGSDGVRYNRDTYTIRKEVDRDRYSFKGKIAQGLL
jgi:hypothetical protein